MTDRKGKLDRLLALVHTLSETTEGLTLEVLAVLREFMASRRQQAQALVFERCKTNFTQPSRRP